MSKNSLSIIIPVYNEERTICSVVEVARSWRKANEIIVVNDGSEDQTLAAVQQFGGIRILTWSTNRGKGYAVMRGIQESKGELVMLLDGDLVGLTHRDLDNLIEPVLKDEADMTIAARSYMLNRKKSNKHLSGERVMRRTDVISFVPKMENMGYGLEIFLNDLYKTKRVTYVPMPYVSVLSKFEKQSLVGAVRSYIQEAWELVRISLRKT